MSTNNSTEVLLIDLGSQYSSVLERKLHNFKLKTKRLLVNSGVIPDSSYSFSNYQAVVISGSPFSVTEFSTTPFFGWIKEQISSSQDIPTLGICFGMQLIHYIFEGEVSPSLGPCYGPIKVTREVDDPLFQGVPLNFRAWASFTDSVIKLGEGYKVLATGEGKNLIASHINKPIYTIQYHPELKESEFGKQLIKNFLTIAGFDTDSKVQRDLDIARQLQNLISQYSEQLKDKKIMVAVSGGLDSSVLALLLSRMVPSENIYPVYISTGLYPPHYEIEVINYFEKKFTNFEVIIWGESIFDELLGIKDAEAKRKIISRRYWDSIGSFAKKQKERGISVFAQGTLCSDKAESGRETKESDVIKSHHNVLHSEQLKEFELVEPFSNLFKDQVRELGAKLNLPSFLLHKQPFPGPGLAIRVIGEVTKEKIELLSEIQRFMEEEFSERKIDTLCDQYFPILLSDKAVGVKGDQRSLGYSVVLRAVKSLDFMSADVSPIAIEELISIGNRIISSFSKVSRVLYDLSTKPGGTIEWE
ncbi:GMP synthase [Mycoplasma wenyonii str. Massachusetts]|uniref:GMP synthase (glutamine-hydrolyzing) n=1 Tax=Mycoplasma wenyonii (strain Massachusetts) TaxID=1197325 RepID=I6YLM9_MYCWM|nr:glutamine-hydrolyzing GMP synthase [Mycoplasma wenyonii]AFN65214.1 GMP synthase [Mycoplasma wenyonii str. Massachusetts]